MKEEKKVKIFGSVILERTLDGLVVFLILLSAVLVYFKQPWIINLCISIGALFIGCLLFFYIIFKFKQIDWFEKFLIKMCRYLPLRLNEKFEKYINKFCEVLRNFVEGFEALNSFKCMLSAFISSLLIWGIECYMTYLVFASFDLKLGIAASLFVISLVSFSTMIPSTSMFLGPYQYAYILALDIFGIDKSTTLAISTVHQGLIVIVLTVIGLYCLYKFNISVKQIVHR